MHAGVMHAGGEVAYLQLARYGNRLTGLQFQSLELEDLGRGAAGFLHVVNGVVDDQSLCAAVEVN